MPCHIATLLCHPTTTQLQRLLKTIYVSNKVTNSIVKYSFITLSNAKSLIFNQKLNWFRIHVVATLMPWHIAKLLCHPTTTQLQRLLKTIYVSNKVTNSIVKYSFITLSNAKSLIFNQKLNWFRIHVVATLMPWHIAKLLCHPTTTQLQRLLKTIYVSNKVTNSIVKYSFITLSNAKSLIFNQKLNWFWIHVVATLMPCGIGHVTLPLTFH